MSTKKVNLDKYMNPSKEGIKDSKAYKENRILSSKREDTAMKSGKGNTIKPIRGKEMNGYDANSTKVYDTKAQKKRSASTLTRRAPAGR